MTEGLVVLKDNLGMGNGFAWNSMWNKMYFVDSYDTNIYEFDFDVKTGNICESIFHYCSLNDSIIEISQNSQPEDSLGRHQLLPGEEDLAQRYDNRPRRQHLLRHVRRWQNPQGQHQVSVIIENSYERPTNALTRCETSQIFCDNFKLYQ